MSLRISQDNFSLREPQETVQRILGFLRDCLDKTGASIFVVGMSGGLDSSVASTLCARAVGGKRVLGLHLPEEQTRSASSFQDANTVAQRSGIKFQSIDITNLLNAAISTLPGTDRRRKLVALGNVKARLRAMVLYYLANVEDGIVVGTGDKSELMLGYFTKYGDGACDILPIADMYKTTVSKLAKHLGIPKRVYSKPASPELWPGQTAKEELGLDYEQIDEILWGLERWMSNEEIALQTSLPPGKIQSVRMRWVRSEHKRRPALTLKLGYRTPGADMRLPL